jgi:predicted GNAT family N-acyltransferase
MTSAAMNNQITVKRAVGMEMDACYRIWQEVFVLEQKVPQELDRVDDDASAIHFIALRDSEPTGTARIVLKDEGKTAKIGRVAILKSARGLGIGKILMEAVLKLPELRGATCLVLDSQTYAMPFYEKLGFQPCGEEFMDVGIPTRMMKKVLKNAL